MTKNMIAVLGALAGFAAAAAVHAETVTVNGSTTVLPAMQLTAEGFMKANPNITVTISGTGSGNGIKALRDGMTDVAMASRDMKDKEVKDFADHNIKTVRYTVAHDAIIPVVNPNNAVKGLTMTLANEWAKYGIQVNAIAPGYMATEMNTALMGDEGRSTEILGRIPARRWGTPEDMKGIAVFLASPASDYVNGAVIPVDGGFSAYSGV